MAFQDYQLAVGHDNAAGLQNIEDILPTYGNRQTAYPQARGEFDVGEVRIRADGLTYISGFAAFTWIFDVLTWEQYDYLQTNYCTSPAAQSGKVTVRTRQPDGVYANYNAVMILPKLPEQDKVFGAIRNIEVRFIRAVAL